MNTTVPPSTAVGPHVLILGLGFAGLRVALDLAKQLPMLPVGTRITGVDGHARHVFTPLLYEVATAHIQTRDGQGVRDAIAGSSVLYQEIFDRLPDAVQFRQGMVTAVDPQTKHVQFADGTHLSYDLLVYATGSVPEYFGIPGAEQYGLPLKTVEDALQLRERLLAAITACRKEACPVVRVLVSGGGPTGTELTGEMTGLLVRLARTGIIQPEAVEVHLVTMDDRVLPMLSASTSRKAGARLQQAGVRLHFSKKVVRVEERAAFLDDGSSLPFDLFVWAGGVRGCALSSALPGATLTKRGTIDVDASFRVQGLEDVFALGDAVCFLHPKTKAPLPALAQEAIHQGTAVARAVVRLLQDKEPASYQPPSSWTVAIPLAGHYALVDGGKLRFSGRLAYVVRMAVDLRYFLSILPFGLGFRHWWRGARLFRKNDPGL